MTPTPLIAINPHDHGFDLTEHDDTDPIIGTVAYVELAGVKQLVFDIGTSFARVHHVDDTLEHAESWLAHVGYELTRQARVSITELIA